MEMVGLVVGEGILGVVWCGVVCCAMLEPRLRVLDNRGAGMGSRLFLLKD